MNTSKILAKYRKFCSLSKPKLFYLRMISSSLSFPKFRKRNFMYFGGKHVETEPSSSHELITFLGYRIPLRWKLFHSYNLRVYCNLTLKLFFTVVDIDFSLTSNNIQNAEVDLI